MNTWDEELTTLGRLDLGCSYTTSSGTSASRVTSKGALGVGEGTRGAGDALRVGDGTIGVGEGERGVGDVDFSTSSWTPSSSSSSLSSSGSPETKGESGRLTRPLRVPLRDSHLVGGVSYGTETSGSYRTGFSMGLFFLFSDRIRLDLGLGPREESDLSLSGEGRVEEEEEGSTASSCLAPRCLFRALHFVGGDGSGREVSFWSADVTCGGLVDLAPVKEGRGFRAVDVGFAIGIAAELLRGGEGGEDSGGVGGVDGADGADEADGADGVDGVGGVGGVDGEDAVGEVGEDGCLIPRCLFRALHFVGGDGSGREVSFGFQVVVLVVVVGGSSNEGERGEAGLEGTSSLF